MSEGWSCPKCGSAHAPWVATCPVVVVTTPVYPSTPSYPTLPPVIWSSPNICTVTSPGSPTVTLNEGDEFTFTSTLTVD